MIKYKVEALKSIFAAAVDGNSADAYRRVLYELDGLPLPLRKKLPFTLEELRQALRPLSAEWQKEIKKITG